MVEKAADIKDRFDELPAPQLEPEESPLAPNIDAET
jgi:hypothetical protein